MKKIASITLALCIIGNIFPIMAMADTVNFCGDDLSWYIDEVSSTLYIEGSGDMYDYGYTGNSQLAPWYCDAEKIEHIKIAQGVTSVGNCAFRNLYFSSADIPDTIVRIGKQAFENSCITAVEIPASVEIIEEKAFSYCGQLTEVRFETGKLKSIGEYAFGNCNELETIVLPRSNTEICRGAFYTTAVKTLDIPEGITCIGENAFNFCDSLAAVTLPEGLTEISNGTFGFCKSLSSVELPDTLTSIGDEAFACCSSLESVRLPDTLLSIGEEAFTLSGLKNVIFGCNIEKIGAYAFYSTPLDAVFLPPSAKETYNAFENSAGKKIKVYGVQGSAAENNENFVPLELSAAEKTGLTEIALVSYDGLEYSTDAESWQSSPVFTGLEPDTEYTFYQRYAATGTAAASPCTTPVSIKTLRGGISGNDYWQYKPDTKTLTVSGNTYLKDYGSGYYEQDWAELKNKAQRLEIIGAEGRIGAYAFSRMTALREVSLCEGITAVGEHSFEGCVSLETVELPDSVAEIGNSAFENSGLKGTLDLGKVTAVGDSAFRNTAVTSARFSPETHYIGFGTFAGTDIKKAVFPGIAGFIAKTAFDASLETVIYCIRGSDAENYAAANGFPYKYLGDLDSDGFFNAADLSILTGILFGKNDGIDLIAADVTCDGNVDILDLIRLKKNILEI